MHPFNLEESAPQVVGHLIENTILQRCLFPIFVDFVAMKLVSGADDMLGISPINDPAKFLSSEFLSQLQSNFGEDTASPPNVISWGQVFKLSGVSNVHGYRTCVNIHA